ncbi:MAG: adenylate cyclase [Planctomycetota bacterium]
MDNSESDDDAIDDASADENADISDESPPQTPRPWLKRAFWLDRLSTGRLVALIAVLVLVGVAAWLMRPNEFVDPAEDLELTAEARLSADLDHILQGETTQLYVPDYLITEEMLDLIPFDRIINDDSIDIDTVLIDQGVVSDLGLAKIMQLPNLMQLRLRRSPISDEGLDPLIECDSLLFLNLPHSQLTTDGVRKLAKLPKLRQLRLASPKLDNEVCHAIASIESLRSIHLIGVPVTDQGLKLMADMPQLESLYLDDSAVTEAGWTWLFQNRNHLHVHVDQRHLDRDPKRHKH